MPLPPLVKQIAEKKLTSYCRGKIPAHLQDEIRLHFKIRGMTDCRDEFPADWFLHARLCPERHSYRTPRPGGVYRS